MFGKNAAKKAEEEAARQRAQQQQYMQQAAQPRPVETELDRQNLGWLRMWDGRQEEGEAAPDIMTAPGFGLQIAAFNADTAEDAYNRDRQGQGLFSLGSNSGAVNPTAVALMKENLRDRHKQQAGLNLTRAAAAKDAEVRGSLYPLLGLQNQRGLSLASLASGNAANADELAFRRRQASGFTNSNLFNQVVAPWLRPMSLPGSGS